VVERQEAEKKKRDEARLKKAFSGNMGDPPSKEEDEFLMLLTICKLLTRRLITQYLAYLPMQESKKS